MPPNASEPSAANVAKGPGTATATVQNHVDHSVAPNRTLTIAPLALAALCFSVVVKAAPVPGSATHCAPDGIALGGNDPVSYHGPDGVQQGTDQFTLEHDGLRYRFVSGENRATFASDPERYLPEYRGWCAATLSFGKLSCPDYGNYKIEDGRLLLFELTGFTNGREVWNSDPLAHRQRADGHFETLVLRAD